MIIDAPSSTKNADQARDPEMHQTKKGNEWYFGIKAHIGADSANRIIHSVAVTAANVADSQVLPHLLHGNETRVWGGEANRGQAEVIPACLSVHGSKATVATSRGMAIASDLP